jgi:hypothetical protein
MRIASQKYTNIGLDIALAGVFWGFASKVDDATGAGLGVACFGDIGATTVGAAGCGLLGWTAAAAAAGAGAAAGLVSGTGRAIVSGVGLAGAAGACLTGDAGCATGCGSVTGLMTKGCAHLGHLACRPALASPVLNLILQWGHSVFISSQPLPAAGRTIFRQQRIIKFMDNVSRFWAG